MGRSVPSSICHKSDLCLIRWRNYKSLNLLKPRTQYATDTGEKFNARESADTGSESGKLKLQITIMRQSRQKKNNGGKRIQEGTKHTTLFMRQFGGAPSVCPIFCHYGAVTSGDLALSYKYVSVSLSAALSAERETAHAHARPLPFFIF